MRVTGKCHCGQYQFQAKVDPTHVSICHCTDCQVLTGCAYRISLHVPVADYKVMAGKVKVYVKTADSGAKRCQAFCPECGTHLYAESLENPTYKSVRWGSIDQRLSLPPRRQIWCQSEVQWASDISGILPRYDKDGKW